MKVSQMPGPVISVDYQRECVDAIISPRITVTHAENLRQNVDALLNQIQIVLQLPHALV
jgi:hypothetical protein